MVVCFLGMDQNVTGRCERAGVAAWAVFGFREADDPTDVGDIWEIKLPVNRTGKGRLPCNRPIWKWDGCLDAPTLRPSIRHTHGHGTAHFFLQGGRIVPCDDNTAVVDDGRK